ncbi:hypothetical protein PVAP13_8KG304450 [Panicum virgatum]|uniref:Uncharacterized protein n=1 Tax=Panicum virgatum TaxID=38727 RepID=A0A8T0PQW6_PANVG|nr:hypothetical protein PVAP13_8KG304450 [Panicum virgatum]
MVSKSLSARVTRVWNAILLGSGIIGTMMHGVINKVYMEKFKPLIEEGNVYIIANVRVTPAAQKYRPMENDKILNFLLTTTLKMIKDTEDILMCSFKVFTTDMLSKRINVDMYLSGVAAHIGQVEEIRTNFGLTKIRDIVLLIE